MPERCVALEEPVVLPDLLGSEDPISVDDWQNTVLVGASAFDEVAGPWMLRRVDGQRILAVNVDGEQALLYWQSNRQWATTNKDVLDPPNQVCFLDYANENGLEVRDIWQSRLLVCDAGQCWAPQMTVRGGVLEESLQEAPAAADANWQQIFRFRDTALTWASDTELLHYGPWEQDPESGAAVPPPTGVYTARIRLLTKKRNSMDKRLCSRNNVTLKEVGILDSRIKGSRICQECLSFYV